MKEKRMGCAAVIAGRGKNLAGGLLLFIGIAVASVLCFSDAMAYTATQCLSNTKDEGECKNCCDCMDTDAAGRTSCRDSCIAKQGDFTANSNFITVTAPSTLGADGDYSAALSGGTEAACKVYCDGSSTLACGDRRYCRDKCNAIYFADAGTTPPDTGGGSGGGISITQAVSDEAQANTIAFDGMAFLTGDLCSNTFLPPGKVADFSGFQYFRDTDPTNLGHNTNFVTIIAYNILNILTEAQRTTLINLAKSQITQISNYGYGRLPLVKAFVRLLNGEIPTGSSGLVKSRVMAYSADLYQLDGQISYDRAKTLGGIIREMTTAQKAKIDALKALNGIGNWDNTVTDPLSSLKLEPALSVAVMTYASEMYSWYAGDVEADTYFCPERQATYFGSFYMKDAPAMAGTNVTISDSLTADVGTDFLNVLDTTQKALVTGLVDIQRTDLYEIVSTRRLISTQLRRFITESSVDLTTVLDLARRYGELDGEIAYHYANNFVQVSKTMTTAQKAQLLPILVKYDWARIACTGGYLYSEKLSALPDIESTKATDYFFTTDTSAAPSAWFGFSPSTPAAGQTISFTDSSAGSPASWSWSFGDGSTSTSQNPSHTFTGANSYTVTLTATNAKGSGSTSRTVTVTSGGEVSASFSFSPASPATGQTITFTDSSSGSPTSWSWDFGDNTTSTSQNPTHAYSTAGKYTVKLTAGTATVSKSITVTSGSSSGVTAGTIAKIAEGFTFTEGPASDASGNLYFSDITANKIFKWSTAGQLSTFKTNTGGANGLFFDKSGNLIACQGTDGKLVSIDSNGNVTTLAEKYNSVRFNEPNDLWIDSKGGIYFSDPLYFGSTLYQGGKHVYYLTPKRDNIVRVVSDMTSPNGLIGTADGKTLYVADHGAGKTYQYSIGENGSLSGKTLFVAVGADGMTIDSEGNVYLATESGVKVYSAAGSLIETIAVANPTNVSFGGADGKTLFITARTAVYSIRMGVTGASSSASSITKVPGDLNSDGTVTTADAVIALQVIAGLQPSGLRSDYSTSNADVNGDGKVGIAEVIYILQKTGGAR